MAAINLAKLSETKVTVPAILLVTLVVVGWQAKDFTIAGLDEFFVSEAEGSEMTKQIEELNENLVTYISKSEIRAINDDIREATTQITETQLYIAANGNNDIATVRLQELVARRDSLRETKACLLDESITNKELCYVE